MATAEKNRAEEDRPLYDRLVELVFSGDYKLGSKFSERKLAEELQVSRIPLRESLAKVVAQGLLLGGGKGEGVRLRRYTPDEIRQLYEFRQFIEVGIVQTAAKYAQAEDLERLEDIWTEMGTHIGDYGSKVWAKLDHKFHDAFAQASHNKRAIQSMRLLLTECHYVFYLRPNRPLSEISSEEGTAWMEKVHSEHRLLIDYIFSGNPIAAEKVMRLHLNVERL